MTDWHVCIIFNLLWPWSNTQKKKKFERKNNPVALIQHFEKLERKKMLRSSMESYTIYFTHSGWSYFGRIFFFWIVRTILFHSLECTKNNNAIAFGFYTIFWWWNVASSQSFGEFNRCGSLFYFCTPLDATFFLFTQSRATNDTFRKTKHNYMQWYRITRT